MINGVIFDMDGLMFDTERMWATFWEPALAALGLEYKEGLAEAERGTAGETSRNIVRQFYGEDCDANAIIDSLHRESCARTRRSRRRTRSRKPIARPFSVWAISTS